jgi:DNA-binding beta-propeller fold protein YncE
MIAPEPVKTVTALPVATSVPNTETPRQVSADASLVQQGAVWGYLDPYMAEEVAVGAYNSNLPDCGNAWLTTLPQESGEITLTLDYLTPVLPEELLIYSASFQSGISRIELLNTQTGLSIQLAREDLSSASTQVPDGACHTRMNLPVHGDFEVNQVIIAFDELAFAAGVAAVELLGRQEGVSDPAVYWRVPLPDTPSDIAIGQNGLVYVATQGNGLYRYDIEGNLIGKIDLPEETAIRKIAVDPLGNLLWNDAASQQFMVMSPQDEQQAVKTDRIFTDIAVNPSSGNIYLMVNHSITIYNTDTTEIVGQFDLDETSIYTNLTFDSIGTFYLLRDFNWNATLIRADPLTGEELDALPLVRTTLVETVANDLATDASGNIYVLFAMNTGQIAIHQLNPDGVLLQRFGELTGDISEWPEGTFLDPHALAVSADGRFVLVADGYDGQAYLTCYLMEIDE